MRKATFVSALSYIADSKNYVSMKVPEQMLNSLIYRPALILRIALNKVLFSKLRKISPWDSKARKPRKTTCQLLSPGQDLGTSCIHSPVCHMSGLGKVPDGRNSIPRVFVTCERTVHISVTSDQSIRQW
ncbi:Cadherin-Related Family Member 5 [Manis pentadactyla]|nr:Cadherin-Related Family Member 5 [Manis pentadactyla]